MKFAVPGGAVRPLLIVAGERRFFLLRPRTLTVGVMKHGVSKKRFTD
jgi:hypothetical protein